MGMNSAKRARVKWLKKKGKNLPAMRRKARRAGKKKKK